MTPLVVGLAVFAAALHAAWNAVLRSSPDHLWGVTVMSFATTAAAAPFLFLLPLPNAGCWPYLAASATLQVGYGVFLAFAYRYGELGQVYPVIRGSVPLMVSVGGFAFAGQRLGGGAAVGVALVSLGVMGVAVGRSRAAPRTLALALATGLFIAGYMTVDAIGVRRAGGSQTYVAWIYLLYGLMMPMMFRLLRGRFPAGLWSGEARKAMGGGLVSLVAYGAVLSALARGPLGPISALRETSIVFSVLIGRFVLGERLTARRVFACAAVTAGAAAIGLS